MLTLFALSAMSVLLQKAFSLHSGFISSLKIAFFFFLCESGNTCGFLSKTCACGIQCFLCLWCFFIIGGFNIKKLKKMAAV